MSLTIIKNIGLGVWHKNAAPITVETDNYLDNGIPRPNFKICIRVEFESIWNGVNIPNYNKSVVLKGLPLLHQNGNHRHTFDVAALLGAWLKESLAFAYLPTVSGLIDLAMVFRNFTTRKWNAYIYEEYGTPTLQGNETPISISPAMRAYWGGTSDLSRNLADFWASPYQSTTVFTHYKNKRMKPNQIDFVTVYNDLGIDLLATVTIGYTDNTTQTIPYPTPFGIPNTGPRGTVMLKTGYEQLNLQAVQPTKIVRYWYITVETSAGEILLTNTDITYHLDSTCKACCEYILYTNSYGVFETINCTGTAIHEHSTKTFRSTRPRGYDANVYDNRTFTTKVEKKQTLKMRTGLVGKKESQLLTQVVDSEILFWIKNGVYIPINVKNGKYLVEECHTGLYTLSFEVEVGMSFGNFDLNTPSLA